MKKTGYQYLIWLVLVFNLLNIHAQSPTEETRSEDTTTYYIDNPYGNNAEITWAITGGTIIGYPSPYTSDGADTILVAWDGPNSTSVNYGSLKVYTIVHWEFGEPCQSLEEQLNVESWARPKALTDTSNLVVCPGEPFTIKVDFEGKPGYRYKWKLYDRVNPALIIEDHSTEFVTCNNTSTDIIIAGLENKTGTEKIYEFEITDVQDGLTDGFPGDVSTAGASIYVRPKTPVGTLINNNNLIRRQ